MEGNKQKQKHNNMAKINLADTPLNEVPPYLRDVFILRGKKAEPKVSGKGNKMIMWRCEIASPLEVEREGKKYSLDGLECVYFLMLTDDGIKDLAKLHRRLELPLEDFDPDNPNCSLYEGIEFEALLNSEEDIPQKIKIDPDTQQPMKDEKGKLIYENMLDAEGKPITKGWRISCNLRDIIGRATSGVNKPY